VLYEGVTGESPFIGDTTIATLMARLGALLPEHEALGPLGEVLMWAAAPDPGERYDAAQFGLALSNLSANLPEPDPLPLVSPGSAPVAHDGDPFLMAAAVGLTPGSEQSERPAATVVAAGRSDLTELGMPTASSPDVLPIVPSSKRRRRRWPVVVAICVLVVAILGAGAAWAVSTKVFTPSSPVPVLVGRTMDGATATAATGHLQVMVANRTSSIKVPTGRIISQAPSARADGQQATLKQGSTIAVVVSTGPPLVTIPNLTTFANCTDAIAALAGVHLVGVCPPEAAAYSSTVAAGAVVDTTPATSARYGSTVTIITSKGHAPVAVPAVTGSDSTYASAAAALTAAGFVPVEAKTYSSTVPVDHVIGTTPATASVQPFGSSVSVQISRGPQPVTVPSLTGKAPSSAATALTALGLVAGGPYGPSGATTVVSTSPAGGTSVPVGSTVNVYTR